MDNILEELQRLNQERKPHKYNKNTEIFSECENILYARLKDDDLKIFNKLIDAVDEMFTRIAFENFIDGATIGAKLIMEISN